MDAIVMAAGEGRRLRPLTEHYAKPVLPIDGRPVIVELLHELSRGGLEPVTVVTGHLAEQVEEIVGDGSSFGLKVRFARQPRADGTADAVRVALASGAAAPALVTAADTLYTNGDASRFLSAWDASGARGAIAWRTDPPAGPGRRPVKISDGLVRRVADDDPANPRGGAPFFGLGPELLSFLEDLPGPPYDLGDAYQRAIEQGLDIAAVEIGKTRDLTYPLDLVKENFPYLSEL